MIFECARAKMARKSWDLLHRSCWVTLEISTLRTSPRMEIPLGSVNTITTRRVDYAHHITASSPGRIWKLSGISALLAPPDFCRSVNSISTREADYAHQIMLAHPGFSDLPTALTVNTNQLHCLSCQIKVPAVTLIKLQSVVWYSTRTKWIGSYYKFLWYVWRF